MAIQNFLCKETAKLFTTGVTSKFTSIQGALERKLSMLNSAKVLGDLQRPPGNALHALTADRAGQHSIRVNDQYRICFVWTSAGPIDVEVVDYH